MDRVTITVKLFAIYQEVYGVSELTLDFPPRTPVGKVLDYLIDRHPELERWRELTRFGVNWQFVEGDRILKNGDEVVLIPPVSGGCDLDSKYRDSQLNEVLYSLTDCSSPERESGSIPKQISLSSS